MHTNQTQVAPPAKIITFRDFTQFEFDARSLMKHHTPFVPVGFPFEGRIQGKTVIQVRFEQKGPRLTWDEIDEKIEPVLRMLEKYV